MNISFGQKFVVDSAQNKPEAFKRFGAYCAIRSNLAGRTLYKTEDYGKDKSKLTLDIHDKLSPKVEEYCKIFNINYSKVD
ncbi:hypothetical protein IKQ26_09095 [bacterium]|nr:hypothetical protein [bacterium]